MVRLLLAVALCFIVWAEPNARRITVKILKTTSLVMQSAAELIDKAADRISPIKK